MYCLQLIFPAVAQEVELQALRAAANVYLDYRKQPENNTADHEKRNADEINKLNQAFFQYALSLKGNFDESNGYRNIPTDKHNKLFKASEILEVNARKFNANGMNLHFVGYNLHKGLTELKNYVLINEASGTIVYSGNDNTCYIDWLVGLDEQHILLSLHHGEMGTSRKVQVIFMGTKTWKAVKAFRGTDEKEQARLEFNLHVSFDALLSLPRDANKVYFDPSQNELYYFKIHENKKIKVSATWKNKLFIINDFTIESTSVPSEIAPVEK
jgi:hypothetical protein